jgi:uncharacterized protein YndB with AHSA1/START domain
MQQITGSKKFPEGIQVSWSEQGNDLNDFFSYEELIAQKVNVLDVLNNPKNYQVNKAGHQIELFVRCGIPSCAYEDEIVISRLFDAPRDLAWRVWTEPDLVMQWWGPKNYTAPFTKIDLRVGGKYLCCMRSPEGRDYWSTGVYREIVRPERIVCTDSFSDEKGNVVPATYYGMSRDMPQELLVTVTFEVLASRTRLTLRHAGFPPGEERDGARAGWNESLDKYAGVLAVNAYKKPKNS